MRKFPTNSASRSSRNKQKANLRIYSQASPTSGKTVGSSNPGLEEVAVLKEFRVLVPKGITTLPKCFLVTALCFGFTLCFAIGPFHAPDENGHFFRIFQLSRGQVLGTLSSDGKASGGVLPADLEFVTQNFLLGIAFNPGQSIGKQRLFDMLKVKSGGQEKFLMFQNTVVYSPIPYIPQIIGVLIGRALDLPIVAILYLARLCSMVSSVCLVFLALRLLPFGLLAIASWLTLPTAIFQFSTVSADGMTIALNAVFAASILRYGFDEKEVSDRARGRIRLSILILGVLLGLCKQAYFPMTLLTATIPSHRFRSARQRWMFVGSVVLCSLMASLLWSEYVKGIAVPLRTDIRIDISAQVAFIAQQPFKFIGISLVEHFTGVFFYLTEQFVGQLGWLDVNLPHTYRYLLLTLLILFTATETKVPPAWGIKQRAVSVAGFIASAFTVSVIMFLYWSPAGEQKLDGLNGRYFVPIAVGMILGCLGLCRLLEKHLPLPDHIQRLAKSFQANKTQIFQGSYILSGLYLTYVVLHRYYLQ